MPTARAYRARRRPVRSEDTRRRIVSAVRELLAEGTFHESTVEEVADRAGIARATLYQHFGSRLELVDAICDTFDMNPALLKLRDVVELPDADAALAETISQTVRFWSSEDAILAQLYGVAAIDPAAQDLVDRQRADRRGEFERLARNLHRARRLRPGLSERRALPVLMLLSSYESFRELRLAALSDREVTKTLLDSARALLLA
jgi:AcrR family transcriptional regulator